METDYAFGAVLTDPSRRYVLVLHASGNHWDHPKGHAEPGESPSETALREIREETHLDASLVEGFQTTAEWVLPDGRNKKVIYYLAEVTGRAAEQGPVGEIIDVVRLPYREARKKITYETGRAVLDRAEEFLSLRQRSAKH